MNSSVNTLVSGRAEAATGELIFIPADLAKPVERTACEVLEDLVPLHRAIAPGFVEALQVGWNGKPAVLFVHEDGRALKLTPNARATAVYQGAFGFRGPQSGRKYTDLDSDPSGCFDSFGIQILGDCFLFTGAMRSTNGGAA